MTRRALAVMLWLVAAISGCGGGGRSGPPPRVDREPPPSTLPTPPPAPETVPPPSIDIPDGWNALGNAPPGQKGAPADALDALEFSAGDGRSALRIEMRWNPATSRLYYESTWIGETEKGGRRPSSEEWARFWTAMDAIGVWGWKPDYEEGDRLHCVRWSLFLQHGSRSTRSQGRCGAPEDGGLSRLNEELARLRGSVWPPAPPKSRPVQR